MAAKKLFKKSEEQLGNSIKHIISTKALSANSIHKLQQAGCNVDSYDIMSIEYRNDSLLKAKIEEINAPFVFTSKHGIYAAERFGLKAQKCYAISPVTSGIAQEAGFLLMTKAKNAKDLALAISHNDEKEIIHLTCPDRRKEMKNSLEEKNIKVHEYDVYFKTPKPKTHTYTCIDLQSFYGVKRQVTKKHADSNFHLAIKLIFKFASLLEWFRQKTDICLRFACYRNMSVILPKVKKTNFFINYLCKYKELFWEIFPLRANPELVSVFRQNHSNCVRAC